MPGFHGPCPGWEEAQRLQRCRDPQGVPSSPWSLAPTAAEPELGHGVTLGSMHGCGDTGHVTPTAWQGARLRVRSVQGCLRACKCSLWAGVMDTCSVHRRRGARLNRAPAWRRSLTPHLLLGFSLSCLPCQTAYTPRAACIRTRARAPPASPPRPWPWPWRGSAPAAVPLQQGLGSASRRVQRSRAWEKPWAGGRHNKPSAPAPRRLSAGREAGCPASALPARPPPAAWAQGHGPPLARVMPLARLLQLEMSQMPSAMGTPPRMPEGPCRAPRGGGTTLSTPPGYGVRPVGANAASGTRPGDARCCSDASTPACSRPQGPCLPAMLCLRAQF